MSDPVEISVAEDMEDNLSISTSSDDHDEDLISDAGQEVAPHDVGEKEWLSQDLDRQLRDVMKLLSEEERKWDDEDHGLPTVKPLEEYKKKAIITGTSPESSRATALHIMAVNYKSEHYDAIPKRILRPVIRDLMAEIFKTSGSAETDKRRRGGPIWQTMGFGNSYEFFEQIKAASQEHLPDLLEAQDAEDKNALHHIFAWPKSTNDTERAKLKEALKMVTTRAKELVSVANGKTISAKDRDGNTPIHYAAHFRQCQNRDKTYVEIFKEMVYKADKLMMGDKAFNKRDESPLLYGQRTRRDYEEQRQKKKQVSSTSDLGRGASPATRQHPSSHKGIDSAGRSSTTWRSSTDNQYLKKNMGLGSETVDKHDSQLDKTKIQGGFDGAGSQHMSLAGGPKSKHPGDSEKMPFPPSQSKAMADSIKSTNDGTKTLREPPKPKPYVAYDEIQEFLTLHYIGSRPDMDARDLIFGKDACVQSLYFDASGHRRADDIVTLIDRMSTGGFFSTQAYVYIPNLGHDQDSGSPKKVETKSYGGRPLENPKLGRCDLVRVFDRLASCGVARILSLQVDDLKEPSHTDSAIELALQGRESLQIRDRESVTLRNGISSESGHTMRRAIFVEKWDWRKPDLSPDVIAFAAPHVEHVSLYWSGNQTVLKGWGSETGIPRLTKLKKLRLYATPGLESIAKMNRMIDIFINEITSRTSLKKDDVKVILMLRGLTASQGTDEENVGVSGSTADVLLNVNQQHKWLETMDRFRKSMVTIHGVLNDMKINMEPTRIKVALIDDGVDYARLHTYDNTVTAVGLSYYPRIGGAEMPWHRSDGHGTIMANMIARINPWVSLQIFRVHNKRLRDGHRTIFADSAARAIRGAVRRQVQIISISWTADAKMRVRGDDVEYGPNTDAVSDLQSAINEAVRSGILIFCSASDEYGTNAKDSLPYSCAPSFVFRIGAALRYGQSAPDLEDKEKIDYLLPGIQVLEDTDPREFVLPKAHDGSSISTALAAGLASLIMYCATVMREYYTKATHEGGTVTAKEFTEFAEALRRRRNMKQAFDNIGTSKAEDRYLEVWNRFESAAKNIADLEKKGDGRPENRIKIMEELGSLVRHLCYDVRYN